MNNNTLLSGDQNYQSAFVKSAVISARNTRLYSLTAFNKGASDYWLELYDHPSAATGTPMEVPLTGGNYASLSWTGGKQFNSGCFVRAVATQGGALIGSDDIKISAEFADGPIMT